MEGCRIDTSKFNKGDKIHIFVRHEEKVEVEMIGRDSCQSQCPIWRVISGPNKGRIIQCGDVIYM